MSDKLILAVEGIHNQMKLANMIKAYELQQITLPELEDALRKLLKSTFEQEQSSYNQDEDVLEGKSPFI